MKNIRKSDKFPSLQIDDAILFASIDWTHFHRAISTRRVWRGWKIFDLFMNARILFRAYANLIHIFRTWRKYYSFFFAGVRAMTSMIENNATSLT
jgi:hypothetical protein